MADDFDGLKNRQDLGRFVVEYLEQNPISMSAVDGLSAAVMQTGRILRWGLVSAAGLKTGGSDGWSVVGIGLGLYSITMTEAFPNGFAVVGADGQGTQRTFTYGGTGPSTFNVAMANGTGAKENIAFSFVVVGA